MFFSAFIFTGQNLSQEFFIKVEYFIPFEKLIKRKLSCGNWLILLLKAPSTWTFSNSMFNISENLNIAFEQILHFLFIQTSKNIRPCADMNSDRPWQGFLRIPTWFDQNIGHGKEYLVEAAGTPYRNWEFLCLALSSTHNFPSLLHSSSSASNLTISSKDSDWYLDDNSYQVYILRSLVWSMQRWWTCGPASWRSRHRRCCTTTSTTTTAAAPWPEYLDKLAIKICFHCTFAHLCPIAPWDILMMVTGFSPNQLKASSPPNLGSPP